jgi:hypothetical protein
MNKDLEILFKKISANMESLVNQIAWIRDNGSDYEQLIDEAYFLTKDSFEIVVQCRALRDMLEDEL